MNIFLNSLTNILNWFFAYIFYPVIVIGVFLILIFIIFIIIIEEKGVEFVRRITAAFLPFICLVFVVVNPDIGKDYILKLILSIIPVYKFIIGTLIGLSLFELSKHIIKKDIGIGKIMCVFYLSIIDVFMLYCFLIGQLGNLGFFIFGIVIAVGFDIIFLGLPLQNETKLERMRNACKLLQKITTLDKKILKCFSVVNEELQNSIDIEFRGKRFKLLLSVIVGLIHLLAKSNSSKIHLQDYLSEYKISQSDDLKEKNKDMEIALQKISEAYNLLEINMKPSKEPTKKLKYYINSKN